MNAEEELLQYFVAPFDEFNWQDNGSVLVATQSGQTIAFARELVPILQQLSERSLPCFQAIAAVVSWLRSPELGAEVLQYSLSESREPRGRLGLELFLENQHRRLQKVPEELRKEPAFKSAVVEAALKPQLPALSLEKSARAAELISRGFGEVIENVAPSPKFQLSSVKANKILERLEQLDFEEIQLQVEIGLSDLPQPIESDELVTPGELLKLIRNEPELAGIAELAEHIQAAISLPRRITDQSDVELGGFSDLTNRGTPDRLLVSELANDDLTLAVRIAMNEAIYLRREIPLKTKEKPKPSCCITGSGLGESQCCFPHQTALAMCASQEQEYDFAFFRTDGKEVEEHNLISPHGLKEQLRHFSTALHPGECLPKFFQTMENIENHSEPILILDEAEFEDWEFQKSFLESDFDRCLVITVNRDGGFHMFHWDKRGIETIRRAQFDLEDVVSQQGSLKAKNQNERLGLTCDFFLAQVSAATASFVGRKPVCRNFGWTDLHDQRQKAVTVGTQVYVRYELQQKSQTWIIGIACPDAQRCAVDGA